jgi:hypothetical protein
MLSFKKYFHQNGENSPPKKLVVMCWRYWINVLHLKDWKLGWWCCKSRDVTPSKMCFYFVWQSLQVQFLVFQFKNLWNSIFFFQLLSILSHPKSARQNIAHRKTDSNLGPKLTLEHRTTTSVSLHFLTSTYGDDCVRRLAAKNTCLDVSSHQYIYL